MREWDLLTNDPLELTLSADFRLCSTDYLNDHTWELKIGGGDPRALALSTTYGLRAKALRIYPGFSMGRKAGRNSGGDTLTDPTVFFRSAHIHHFYPNYLQMDFYPFEGLSLVAEWWVPDSHSIAGRYSVTNEGKEAQTFFLDLFGQLVPIDGHSFTPVTMQSVNVLAAQTSKLYPVIFITGGPQPGSQPHPSLSLDISLSAGERRIFTWVQAALETPQESFDYARRIAARAWESERTKIEMANASQSMDIITGDPDWDAVFAFSQKTAFRLFFSPTQYLANPSFVQSRQSDHGYSIRGDGKDHHRLWNGQSPLDSYFLSNILPGTPELTAGLIRNFLSLQSEDGSVDWRPGLSGQRGRWLAPPILSSLAWNAYLKTRDVEFLKEIHEGLTSFVQTWFKEEHDRDQDGFPEWDNPLQYGLEDNPTFCAWAANGQGVDISTVENPALVSLLCRETRCLAQIADILDFPEEGKKWLKKSGELGSLTEECWDSEACNYLNRDRDFHNSPTGKTIGEYTDPGRYTIHHSFRQPSRLIIQIILDEEITRRVEILIHGETNDRHITERMERSSFQWGQGLGAATSRNLFTKVDDIEILGLENNDRVNVNSVDLSGEDITLFMPLWADIPHSRRTQTLVDRKLFDTKKFWGTYGIPVCADMPNPPNGDMPLSGVDSHYQEVHIPWNAFIGEALIDYGFRVQAAELVTHIMAALITNLKKEHAFSQAYHSRSGAGLGEKNALQGLAPLGLFLQTLGVEIESNKRIHLSGMNPFPWPVTVKYRGLTVTREKRQTFITFPNGQDLRFDDPVDSLVSIE